MINAKPQLNGNPEKDFMDAALKLSQAIGQVEAALQNINANVFHGRNYQHIPEWQEAAARGGDDTQMKFAYEAVSKLQYLAKQIADKALEDA